MSLEDLAKAAQQKAYAPYSKFRVGAALRASGKEYEGANIENASYSLTICAERAAMVTAAVAGSRDLEEVVVFTDAWPPSSPCGACRQFLSEFAADPSKVTVTAVNAAGQRRSWTLAELLPDGFSGRELP